MATDAGPAAVDAATSTEAAPDVAPASEDAALDVRAGAAVDAGADAAPPDPNAGAVTPASPRGSRAWVAPDGTRHVLPPHVPNQFAPGFAPGFTVRRDARMLCVHDADCRARPRGICQHIVANGGAYQPPRSACVYDACQRDADCGGQQVCAPSGYAGLPRSRCVPARCRRNADCAAGPGGRCQVLSRWTGSPTQHTAPDFVAACVYAGAPCDAQRPCADRNAQCWFYDQTGAPVCSVEQPVP